MGGEWPMELVGRATRMVADWSDAQERGDALIDGAHRLYGPADLVQPWMVEYHGSLVEFHGTALLGGWCECDECHDWGHWGEPGHDRALLIGRDRAGELHPLVAVRRRNFTLPEHPGLVSRAITRPA